MATDISIPSSFRTDIDILESRISNAKIISITDMKHVGGMEWRFSSSDPSVVLKLDQTTFANNICLLVLDVRPSRPGAVGKLYVDYGAGFSEIGTANIDYSRTDGALAILTDADRIRTLRWDPDDQDGAGIAIERLRILEADSTIEALVEDHIEQARLTEKNKKIFSMFLSKIKSVLPKTIKQKRAETFSRLNVVARQKPGVGGTSLMVQPGKSGHGPLGETLFIIPSINGARLLERMLPSLDLPKSCIVVLDQGSTDWTEELCRRSGVELIQLGTPKTYTQACNIGLDLARQRGLKYLYIANNDIRFVTNVAQELLAEILEDDRLAIVAPSQIIVDERKGLRLLANRVHWDLSGLNFAHDFQNPTGEVERIEADFCELTCALLRVSAATEVGGFDDEFGFYHEDADLCFRLREAGYTSAYLPRSQIEHYASSTFGENLSAVKQSYLLNSKRLFARKHLGFGVHHADHKSNDPTSWNIINRHLHPYLRRNGLIDPSRPELIFTHPGTKPFDYLYSVWETDKLPDDWSSYASSYRATFNPSKWGCEIYEKAGFSNVHYVPLGVETDTFHPWGASERRFDEKTYLWFGRNQHRKGLDVMLKAWHRFRASAPNAKLIVMGHAVLADYQHHRNDFRQWRGCIVLDFPRDGIQFRETIDVMSDHELAIVYRSVDFLVSTARSEGFGFSIVEAMATGLTPIFPGYAAGSDMLYEGALTITGVPTKANYRDKGYGDVGNWWEPSVESVVLQLNASLSMSDGDRRRLGQTALRMVRSQFTWRQTCMRLRSALRTVQLQADVSYHPPVVEQSTNQTMLDVAVAFEKEYLRTGSKAPATADGRQTYFDGFDREHYSRYNPDVIAAGLDPLSHFTMHGWIENRAMSPHYGVAHLLAANRTVRLHLLQDAGIDLTLEAIFVSKDEHEDLPTATVPPVHGPDHIAAHAEPKHGVLFVGYVEAGLGLGESLRRLIQSVSSSDINPKIYPYNVLVADRFVGRFSEANYDQDNAYEINVFEMAAEQLPEAMDELGGWRTKKSYNILRAYWELPKADQSWRSALSKVDELWAPTHFIAESFRSIYDGKVTIVPTIVDVDKDVGSDRKSFGLDDDRFYFVFSFDYHSATARKNPLAVLQAFQKAFPEDEGVGLVIKSIGPENSNARVRAEIERVVRNDPRVVVVDRSLSREHMTVLLKSCDCYVSLHRSEGFGLGMAEAMMLSKPVIGTGYGGCTDFLSDETGFPVAYTLRRLLHGEYPFSDNLSWAEPDIDDAVKHMKAVFADRPMAEAKATAGHRFIAEHFSPEKVGAIAVDRIKDVFAARAPRSSAVRPRYKTR